MEKKTLNRSVLSGVIALSIVTVCIAFGLLIGLGLETCPVQGTIVAVADGFEIKDSKDSPIVEPSSDRELSYGHAPIPCGRIENSVGDVVTYFGKRGKTVATSDETPFLMGDPIKTHIQASGLDKITVFPEKEPFGVISLEGDSGQKFSFSSKSGGIESAIISTRDKKMRIKGNDFSCYMTFEKYAGDFSFSLDLYSSKSITIEETEEGSQDFLITSEGHMSVENSRWVKTMIIKHGTDTEPPTIVSS